MCDLNRDRVMNPREWCRCFEKSDRPCAAVRRRLSGNLIGSYAPDCDDAGFYKPTQCHSSVGICWCVNKHGVEFANTRTRDKPKCGKFAVFRAAFYIKLNIFHSTDELISNESITSATFDDEDDETDDDDGNSEGSADKLLVF